MHNHLNHLARSPDRISIPSNCACLFFYMAYMERECGQAHIDREGFQKAKQATFLAFSGILPGHFLIVLESFPVVVWLCSGETGEAYGIGKVSVIHEDRADHERAGAQG